MSVRAISQVLDKSAHGGTELLMLIILADYSDDEGNSYPSVSSLARKCRLKPRRANYILKALTDSGELRILKNEGPKGTNRYRLIFSAMGQVQPLHSSAPLHSAAPLHSSAGGGALQCAKPLHSSADEPSLNRQEPSVQINADALFVNFWTAYPRKAAKPAAAKAFKSVKVNALLLQIILADIERRKAGQDWQKEDGKFVPNPATYLNQRRWEDETTSSTCAAKAEPKPWDGAR